MSIITKKGSGASITGVGRYGVPACDAAGIPIYQLNLPAAELFNGAPTGIPAAAVAGFNLDL
ncbi:hypothetical protein BC937DRAFT_94758 [Endogone sp. FLAS-F59071]|nr:hypothetical protein BC937DRAFT_94758 [Endogone sp. FLAS-F59071]|eukprot:RUS20625.1 hypothetical protein BC937DRAFT_94758 [Endogone sp. FLAS-F59071]